MRVGVIGHPKIRIGGGSGQFNFLCSPAARRHFFQICTSLVESGRSSQKSRHSPSHSHINSTAHVQPGFTPKTARPTPKHSHQMLSRSDRIPSSPAMLFTRHLLALSLFVRLCVSCRS
ncbi:hypothetical protein L1887_47821 [Cichorium endivia]|nr:hypothetical protein L1887_47821 [Cichorium endivia]